jgi:hypothetical protein
MSNDRKRGTSPAQQEADFQRGIVDGEAYALTFPDVRTHSVTAPLYTSFPYKAGWRVGFARVRTLRVCEDRLAAGDETYRDQFNRLSEAIGRQKPEK